MEKSQYSCDLKVLSNLIANKIDEILIDNDIFLNNYGDHYEGCCPIHNGDSKTAFNIYMNENSSRPVWNCFTRQCQTVFFNDMVGLVRAILSSKRYDWKKKGDKTATINEVIDYVKKLLNIDKIVAPSQSDKDKRNFINITNRIYNQKPKIDPKWNRSNIINKLDIPSPYFLKRGYLESTLRRFDVGDVYIGYYQDRAVVPIYLEDKYNIYGLTARAFDEVKNPPKWKNSNNFSSGSFFYNQVEGIKAAEKTGKLYIVEGPPDVWRMIEAGFENTIGLLGCDITDQRQIILEKANIQDLICFFDFDDAGQEAFSSTEKLLKRMFNVKKVRSNDNNNKDAGLFSSKDLREFILCQKF